MDFLDAGSGPVRNAEMHVVGAQRRAHLPAAVAGERDDADAELVRGLDRVDDVGRIAAGRDREQRVAAPADEPPLPHDMILPPPRSASTKSSVARASGSASTFDAASLRFALSVKCVAKRD